SPIRRRRRSPHAPTPQMTVARLHAMTNSAVLTTRPLVVDLLVAARRPPDLARMESDDLEISLRELLPVRGCRTVALRRPGLEAGFAVVEGHRRRRRTGVDAATEELELRGATAAQADAGEEVATRNELRVHAERRDRQPGELTIQSLELGGRVEVDQLVRG